jgi:hypothetical protein
MKKLLIAFMISFCFYGLVLGQLKHNMKIKEIFENNDLTFTNILYDYSTDNYIGVYEKSCETKIISSGRWGGMRYDERVNGIIFSDSSKVELDKNELPFYCGFNTLLTVYMNYNNTEKTIRSYKITSNNLKLNNSLVVSIYSNPIVISEDGNFCISDFGEGAGRYFSIISKDLDILNNYEPFDNVYDHISFDTNNDIFVATAYNADEKSMKIYLFDSDNGTLLKEKEFIADRCPLRVKIHRKNVITYLSGLGEINDEVKIYNMDLNIIWKMKLTKPIYNSTIMVSGGNLIFKYPKNIKSYYLSKGRENWTKKLQNAPIHRIKCSNDLLCAVAKKPTCEELIFFDSNNGEIWHKEKIIMDEIKYIVVENNKFYIISNHKIQLYER